MHAVELGGVREDEVALVVGLEEGAARGRARAFALERLEVGVGEEVDEDGIRVVHRRGEEHLEEDAVLLEAARLGGDVLDVSRGEVAAPTLAVVFLLNLRGGYGRGKASAAISTITCAATKRPSSSGARGRQGRRTRVRRSFARRARGRTSTESTSSRALEMVTMYSTP